MYKFLDNIIKGAVLEIYKEFSDFRLQMQFDELNIFSATRDLYNRLNKINNRNFKKIANFYYKKEFNNDDIEDILILDWLNTPSKVIKYTYSNEVIRKRDRLIETLTATNKSVYEIDKAMRYWTQMMGWFAVDIADNALYESRKINNVEFVRWVSEHDERVCQECFELDGVLFPLTAVPVKPHPNCRCYTIPILQRGENTVR